jgi:hypothetical protein
MTNNKRSNIMEKYVYEENDVWVEDDVEFVSYDSINDEGSNDGWDSSGYDVNYDDKDDWS